MDAETLDRLMALADAATPGEWYVIEDAEYVTVQGPDPDDEIAVLGTPNAVTRADAAFVAAANPDTIRALVADLRNLRAAFLEVATEAGEDTSDLDHPDQLAKPTIQEFALAAVRGLREAYHEALDEPAVAAVREPLDDLGAAWAEARAALPDGWRPIHLAEAISSSRAFFDDETSDEDQMAAGYGSSPAAALRALAAALEPKP